MSWTRQRWWACHRKWTSESLTGRFQVITSIGWQHDRTRLDNPSLVGLASADIHGSTDGDRQTDVSYRQTDRDMQSVDHRFTSCLSAPATVLLRMRKDWSDLLILRDHFWAQQHHLLPWKRTLQPATAFLFISPLISCCWSHSSQYNEQWLILGFQAETNKRNCDTHHAS